MRLLIIGHWEKRAPMNHKRLNDKMFEILVHEHHRRILAYALSLVRREEVAEDLVQNALIAAYRKISAFDPSRDFGNWVRGMVRMEYLNWVRAESEVPLEQSVLDALDWRHRQWDEAARGREAGPLDALQHCLQRLQESVRQVVDAFYIQRLDCNAIGEKTGVPPPAIRKRLERARQFLLECITRRMNADEVPADTGAGSE